MRTLNIYVETSNGERRFEKKKKKKKRKKKKEKKKKKKKTDQNSEVHRTVTKDFISSIVDFRDSGAWMLNSVPRARRGSS